MRGGQSPASETLSSCSRFATNWCVAKKQTFSSAHTKRVVKKANDYPAIIAAFSTEVCCFFLFYCLDDEKPGNVCANVIVDAQDCSVIEPHTVQDCDKKSSEMTKILRLKSVLLHWRRNAGDIQLKHQHQPEPPPRARMRCVDVGGNPPVYQRDREKDKDRKTN